MEYRYYHHIKQPYPMAGHYTEEAVNAIIHGAIQSTFDACVEVMNESRRIVIETGKGVTAANAITRQIQEFNMRREVANIRRKK